MDLKNLDELIDLARGKPLRRIAVAAAADSAVLKAVYEASKMGFIKPVLVGDPKSINELSISLGIELNSFEIIDESDPEKACKKAVMLVSEGKAEILMKGMVRTAVLLKAVLDKKNGLRDKKIISHFALFQTSYYHKLFGLTDAAINISPGLKEKVSIIENAVDVLHRLGNQFPKVAVLAPIETVNDKIPSCKDAAALKIKNRRNRIKGCIIDGPLALDLAISREAAGHKGISSDVAGDADILVTPDLNTGNILYKSLVYLSDGIAGAIVTGARAPVVLTSRADNEKNKLFSIALAAALE